MLPKSLRAIDLSAAVEGNFTCGKGYLKFNARVAGPGFLFVLAMSFYFVSLSSCHHSWNPFRLK